ncbi:MAG: GFA family protein [Pseudomonadota bacterium]
MKGSCLCGKIQFEIQALLPDLANCHCSMCQKFHGAAYATYGTVTPENFKWLAGEAMIKTYVSSATAERGFCSHCGSSIYYKLRKEGSGYEIALGVLDDEPNYPVNANIYWSAKPNWSKGMENLPNFSEARPGD